MRQWRGKFHFLNKPETALERGLDILSPELRDKVQKLVEIPLLPDWPEKTRGVPNLCLRSALFGVIKRGRRRAVKGELVAAVKGLDIRYTGWRLDQGDFDVLAACPPSDCITPAGRHLAYYVQF